MNAFWYQIKTSRSHLKWAAHLFVFLLASTTAPQVQALDCAPDDIELSTQVGVDNFQTDHGPCDHVVGNLTVLGSEILNVDGLAAISSIGGNLILGASALPNVDGLSSLQDVGDWLVITGCEALLNVEGLSGLEIIGGKLSFIGSFSLVDLDGLGQLNSVGSLYFENNPLLENVDALLALESVGGEVRFDTNASLANLDGLTGLDALPGDLYLWNNYALTQLDGLSNISAVGGNVEITSNFRLEDLGLGSLGEVGGYFYLERNHSLTNVDGLANLISVGDYFDLEHNSNLTRCTGLIPLLNTVDDGVPGPGPGPGGVPDVGGDVILDGNLVGCNSLAEIPRIALSGFEGPFNTIHVLDDELFDTGRMSSIAIGGDGLPVISYDFRDLVTLDITLRVAKCLDLACNTATITQISGATDYGGGSSLAIGNDGFPIIAYHGEQSGSLRVVRCNDAACIGDDETFSTVDDSANYVGNYSSITMGLDGLPVISYRDETADTLKVAKCNDASCAGGDETITTINDLSEDVGLFTSIAMGTDGFPVIGYLERLSSFESLLKVAKCNDAACAGQDETISEISDATSYLVADTSIAVAGDGFPILAFVGLDGEIKAGKCNDGACSGGDESVLSIDPVAGRSPSVALGSDGFPVVSYVSYPDAELKVARCENADCSGTISRAVVDNEYGYDWTSVAIGTDGLPIISYHDVNEMSLKVAHCESLSCQ